MLIFFCKQIQRRSTNFQAHCSRLFKVSLQQLLDKFRTFHPIFLLNFNPYKTEVSDGARSYLNQNSVSLGRLRFATLLFKGRLSDELIIVPILHDRRILTVSCMSVFDCNFPLLALEASETISKRFWSSLTKNTDGTMTEPDRPWLTKNSDVDKILKEFEEDREIPGKITYRCSWKFADLCKEGRNSRNNSKSPNYYD